MSTQVCKRHRRSSCGDCRAQSRTTYGEDYASNLFTSTAAFSFNAGSYGYDSSSSSSDSGSSSSSSCGSGGGE